MVANKTFFHEFGSSFGWSANLLTVTSISKVISCFCGTFFWESLIIFLFI
uniref:Uncharacterized protein n=1 Tax=uncultured marine virus TaxID=186617 RepID=A0A0F7L636_9VIRU|nr:hypothetical protein [uncultured marine virus]